jgi:hypothetical protein
MYARGIRAMNHEDSTTPKVCSCILPWMLRRHLHLLIQVFKQTHVKWQPLPQPSSTLCVVSCFLAVILSVRMYERTQWPSVDDQPWDESPKLCRCEEIHLEHGNGVGAYRPVKQPVYAQFGNLTRQPRSCRMLSHTYIHAALAPIAPSQRLFDRHFPRETVRKARWHQASS